MQNARKIEILLDVKWRLEGIFCHLTSDREDALDNQFKAWDVFIPQIECYLEEFLPCELDTDPLALLLMDFVYDEVDLIREGLIDETYEDGRNVWGLYKEDNYECIKTWVDDFPSESLKLVNAMLEELGVIAEPPRWIVS